MFQGFFVAIRADLLCGLDEPLSNSSLLAAIFLSAVLLGQKVRSKSLVN
jgi:hypothetical protein